MNKLTTIILSFLGAIILYSINVPLPFLFGPMFVCLLLSLMGYVPIGMPKISEAARTILGLAIGTSITVAFIVQIPELIRSIMLIPFFLILVACIGIPWFRRICGLDFITSYYAAMPGGLQDMVMFGDEAGGNVRALSLIHATRVLLIVSTVPLILIYGFDVALDQPLGLPATEIAPLDLFFMFLAAVIGWKGGKYIGLFGASILGPLVVSAIFSIMGLVDSRPPHESIIFAQFFIGLGIGTQFSGITMQELRKFVLSGIGYTIILWGIAIVFTLYLVPDTIAPQTDLLLAFVPGGQAEMVVLAIVSGADLSFIISHHITRIVLVIIGAPLVIRFFKHLEK